MVKKNAIGAIEMLLTLLVVSLLAIAIIPLLKGSSSAYVNNSQERSNIQKNIDEQVNQIEQIKRQNAKMLENVNQDY